jgi:hypothetical protein
MFRCWEVGNFVAALILPYSLTSAMLQLLELCQHLGTETACVIAFRSGFAAVVHTDNKKLG